MDDVIFDLYQITCHQKNYYVLQPGDIGQFWVVYVNGGCNRVSGFGIDEARDS